MSKWDMETPYDSNTCVWLAPFLDKRYWKDVDDVSRVNVKRMIDEYYIPLVLYLWFILFDCFEVIGTKCTK